MKRINATSPAAGTPQRPVTVNDDPGIDCRKVLR